MIETTETDTEASLRDLGVQADNDENFVMPDVSEKAPASPPAPVEKAKPQASEAAKDQPPAKDAKQSEKSADSVTEKAPSKYVQAKEAKAQTRAAEQFKKLEDERAAFAKERQEFEAAKAEKPQAIKDDHGFTAADYARAAEDAARDADESLDDAEAKRLTAMAKDMKATAERMQQAEQQQQTEAASAKWHGYLSEFAKSEPDIAADLKAGKPESPLGKAICDVLKELPGLLGSPEGIKYAVPIAKSRLTAATLPALQKQIEELTTENKRLTELTSLTGSGPAKIGSEKSKTDFDENDLRRMAAEEDNSQAA